MIKEHFFLKTETVLALQNMKPEFGYDGFGEIVFYRTYSRLKPDGSNENWADVVIRVINGCMCIRKDWYLRNFIKWDESYWQEYAYNMALSMFRMEWIPPGRGLWAMGTEFVFERGSMALNNCSFVKLKSASLGSDFEWMMDALMLGVGVGFEPVRDHLELHTPIGTYHHMITDDREGWVNSVRLLVDAYTIKGTRRPIFNYELIRAAGSDIRGFGGKASGPDPLKRLHKQIDDALSKGAKSEDYDEVRIKTDIANQIGVCVVAGNVRRSAELCQGRIDDSVFLDLKRDPTRSEWGYMSNNSAILYDDEDFQKLDEVAKRVIERGEPGILNLRNFKHGRIGKKSKGLRYDHADGLNPCAEITLEDYELCNLVETCPTKCATVQDWYNACKYATMYASTVSLLPTHRPESNRVISRNRRIGVGIVDWTGWVHKEGLHKVTKYMRIGYKTIRKVNSLANGEAGVPASIKVTCLKPGGSVPKLPGLTSGCGYPTFHHTLRRIRVATNHPMIKVLDTAGIPWEPEKFDPAGTRVYAFPILQGPAEAATNISLWEQAVNLATLQREWADNAVSNTLYFQPKWVLIKVTQDEDLWREILLVRNLDTVEKLAASISYKVVINEEGYKLYQYNPGHEEDQILKVLAAFAPLIKSCSLLPHAAEGVYDQMPEEGISEEKYHELRATISPIDWSNYRGSDGLDEKYCQGDNCLVSLTKESL
jgi:ribonucleoside-triphosphate reductase (thioredoxin)